MIDRRIKIIKGKIKSMLHNYMYIDTGKTGSEIRVNTNYANLVGELSTGEPIEIQIMESGEPIFKGKIKGRRRKKK